MNRFDLAIGKLPPKPKTLSEGREVNLKYNEKKLDPSGSWLLEEHPYPTPDTSGNINDLNELLREMSPLVNVQLGSIRQLEQLEHNLHTIRQMEFGERIVIQEIIPDEHLEIPTYIAAVRHDTLVRYIEMVDAQHAIVLGPFWSQERHIERRDTVLTCYGIQVIFRENP